MTKPLIKRTDVLFIAWLSHSQNDETPDGKNECSFRFMVEEA